MPDVLVRDLDETALARLKEKANSHGRSLGVELKFILEQAAKQLDMLTARELAERMSRSLAAGSIRTVPSCCVRIVTDDRANQR